MLVREDYPKKLSELKAIKRQHQDEVCVRIKLEKQVSNSLCVFRLSSFRCIQSSVDILVYVSNTVCNNHVVSIIIMFAKYPITGNNYLVSILICRFDCTIA